MLLASSLVLLRDLVVDDACLRKLDCIPQLTKVLIKVIWRAREWSLRHPTYRFTSSPITP
jgi:hypothetical protein